MGKEMSGRKFATVSIITTYCVEVIGSLILTILKIMSIETFLATSASLGTLAMYIIKAYFDDKERNNNSNGETK